MRGYLLNWKFSDSSVLARSIKVGELTVSTRLSSLVRRGSFVVDADPELSSLLTDFYFSKSIIEGGS